jgi:hypothetical protein
MFTNIQALTPHFVPVDSYKNNNNITITINRTNERRRPWRNNNLQENDSETEILSNVDITDLNTLNALYKSDKNIYITSDGGVYNSQGTFGVVLPDEASLVMINHGKLYSPPLYESLYRSEAYGMLADLKMLQYQ